LVGWAWIEHRRVGDSWLRRTLISALAIIAWFLPWYLRRYTSLTWPIADLFKTLGLGFVSAMLLFLWDWARGEQGKRKKDQGNKWSGKPELTGRL